VGLSQPGNISIGSFGTISYRREYVCGNYNSTHYYAQNNATGEYEWTSTDATQAITYALSNLTPERTWRETVLLRGNFSISTTIVLSVGNVVLDCRQARLTLAANTILLDVHPERSTQLDVTIVGGHWIGRDAGSGNAIRFMYAHNCTLRAANIEGFPVSWGAVSLGFRSARITVQDCWIHDNGAGNPCINIGNSGYNRIINCSLGNSGTGVMVNGETPANQIRGCEFYGWATSGIGQHGIYLDGNGRSNEGHNIVSGCTFHDPHDSAGILLKCHNNTIYNNVFYNFIAASVGISIFSEYNQATANDNKIYGNTFADMVEAIWVGHDPANNPTLRNEIYRNNFTRATNCIRLNPWSGAIDTVEDTWIYYNTFASCTDIFPRSGSSASLIIDTVVAYNDFGANVTNLSILSYANTMVYGNLGMADFNVPSPLPIPPP
jgi:hypothetical protein